MDLGPLTRSAEADLTPAFRHAGFEIAVLRSWEATVRNGAIPTPSLLSAVGRSIGRFGLDPERNVEVPLEGEISYVRRRGGRLGVVRFFARVPATIPFGLGDYQPPTARYGAAMLATSGKTYERLVPLSQSLKGGATDRFEILVYAARSSRHDLRVRLIYGKGESIASAPISLDLFVPRNPE